MTINAHDKGKLLKVETRYKHFRMLVFYVIKIFSKIEVGTHSSAHNHYCKKKYPKHI